MYWFRARGVSALCVLVVAEVMEAEEKKTASEKLKAQLAVAQEDQKPKLHLHQKCAETIMRRDVRCRLLFLQYSWFLRMSLMWGCVGVFGSSLVFGSLFVNLLTCLFLGNFAYFGGS